MTVIVAPATFDYVCHALKCPRCDHVSDDPCAIDLQTKLCARPEMAELHVGDRIDVREDLEAGGYSRVCGEIQPQRVRVIDAWSCPNCGANFLWALIEVDDGRISGVEHVDLTEQTLARADYISAEVFFLFPTERTLELHALGPRELCVEVARVEAERLLHSTS